jgi:hypothetical protein
MNSLPLFGILLPALIAGIMWGVAWQFWLREPVASSGWRMAHALALPAAFVSAHVALWGWPGWQPRLAEGWLCALAVGGALLAWVQNQLRASPAKVILWVALDALALRLFVQARASSFSPIENFGWLGQGTFLIVLVHISLETLSARRPGVSLPLALWVWAAGSAAALAATGSLKYGQLAGILAAILGAACVAAWIQPRFTLAEGVLNGLVPCLMGTLICGTLYSDLPLSSAIVLAAAPLALWLIEVPALRGRSGVAGAALRVGAVALPVAVALVLACWPMIFPSEKSKGQGDVPY